MAEEEARRKAPPVAGHTLAAIISVLGDFQTEDEKRRYLGAMLDSGKLTEVQHAYVIRVAAL